MLALLTAFVLVPLQDLQDTAQAARVAPLTDAEKRALAVITEEKVRKRISYLASDELAGRDTGSKGLAAASDFVKARFQAAGLEGLVKKDEFFLYATSYIVPEEGIVLEEDGKALPHLGLLAAADQKLELQGEIPFLTGVPDSVQGAAIVRETRSSGGGGGRRFRADRQAAFSLVSLARRYERAGAKALLVAVAEDSALRGMAKRLRGKEATGAAAMLSRAGIPLLLVPEGTKRTGKVRLVIPAYRRAKSENKNVAAVLRGSDPELRDEALLVTAHLDHIGVRGRGEDNINNGADDNASGVTAVLGIADAFAALKTRPKRSVIFMTFWGEERGLLGSRQFAREPSWPLAKIVANVNIEMVGRPEAGAKHKAWMTGWTKSDLGELMAIGAKRAGVEVFRHRRFSPMLYRSSDNWAFVEKGVIAHSFSAGSLHEDYHRPGDHWDKLDLPHMTKVIQGLFAGCLPIARGTLTPAKK